MQLTIFGATGKTGMRLVQQALDAGHAVRAFVRDPAKLSISHDKLQAVQGDILDAASVDAALSQPADAVLSALGIFHREPKTDLSDGTANVISAMQKHGIKRLGVVSSLGAGDSAGQGNFLARNLQKFLLSHVLADKERQEQLIMSSGLDWTIVRPPQLTDDDRICEKVVAWVGPTPKGARLTWKTSRATVAGFLLKAVAQGSHIGEAVNISEPK